MLGHFSHGLFLDFGVLGSFVSKFRYNTQNSLKYFGLHMSLTLQKVSQFHLIFWCENFVERHSFWRVSGNLVFMVFFAVWYMDISIFCAQNSFRRLDL